MKFSTMVCTVVAVAAFVGSATTGIAQSGPSKQTQDRAILACKNALGVGGGYKTRSVWQSNTPFGGQTVVTIVPFGEVTPALANQINACAANSVGLSAAATVTAAPTVAPQAFAETVSAAPRGKLTVPGCPPRFNGMFRGTLYCVNGRPVR